MQRFLFHITDGDIYQDDEGTELTDLDAARVEAVKIMSQALKAEARTFWQTGQLEVTVADDRNLTLFCLRTWAVDATATARPRRG
jgi:hypothetical protein